MDTKWIPAAPLPDWKSWSNRARELSGFKGWLEKFASWLCLVHDSYAAELKEALDFISSIAEGIPAKTFNVELVRKVCTSKTAVPPALDKNVKELSGGMARPTFTCLQRLKKLVGYLKSTPDVCVMLDIPTGGQDDGVLQTSTWS